MLKIHKTEQWWLVKIQINRTIIILVVVPKCKFNEWKIEWYKNSKKK